VALRRLAAAHRKSRTAKSITICSLGGACDVTGVTGGSNLMVLFGVLIVRGKVCNVSNKLERIENNEQVDDLLVSFVVVVVVDDDDDRAVQQSFNDWMQSEGILSSVPNVTDICRLTDSVSSSLLSSSSWLFDSNCDDRTNKIVNFKR